MYVFHFCFIYSLSIITLHFLDIMNPVEVYFFSNFFSLVYAYIFSHCSPNFELITVFLFWCYLHYYTRTIKPVFVADITMPRDNLS